MSDDFITVKIMELLSRHARGRQNAIPRKELAGKLRRFAIDIADRQLRDIYSTLPICSCNDGIFIPRTPEEVQKYREYLRPHMSPEKVQARITILLTTWPHLAAGPGVQLEMFDGRRAEVRS